MEISAGRIVWAPVLDPNEKNLKVRPLVVVEAPKEDRFAAVAVTTSIEPFDEQTCVRLPWHRDEHPRTKLRSKCIARCDWVVRLNVADISHTGGTVPEFILNAIFDRLPKEM